jgi:hypothetical protein
MHQPTIEPTEPQPHDTHEPEPSRGWLGWLVSGTVHASVLCVFAYWVWTRMAEPIDYPPVVIASRPPVVQPEEKPVVRERMPVDTQPVPLDTAVEVDVAAPVSSLDIPQDVPQTDDNSDAKEMNGDESLSDSAMGGPGVMAIIGPGGPSKGRIGRPGPGGRLRTGAPFGMTPKVITHTEMGLRWLRRHQNPDGAWDAVTYAANCQENPKCEPGANQSGDTSVALTGYALLCFLGSGYDHRVGSYRGTVRKGLDALVARQGADGLLGKRNYEHAIAAQALFEAYGMTEDPALREPCEKALAVILARQAKDPKAADSAYAGLGWDYVAANPARIDSSVSGWNVMALKAAHQAGLAGAKAGLDGAKRWLDRAWAAANRGAMPKDPYGDSVFPYTWDATTDTASQTKPSNKSHDLTPVGMVCAVFLGHDSGDVMLETMANHVITHQQPTSWATYNSYYTYYNTMGMFQVGGDKWKAWNGKVRDIIIDAQRIEEGCFQGSWDWDGAVAWHGVETGRVLSTCYAILNLEVYYRKERVTGERGRRAH